METQTTATSEVTARRRSLPEANPGDSTTVQRPGPVTLILLAACFGLGTGLVELVLMSCWWAYDPTMRLGWRVVNRHYLWMIPCAHLVIFGACGLALGLIARFWPTAAHKVAAYLLSALASLALLLIYQRLYVLTYVLLACGIASLTAPLIEARTRRFRLRALRDLPWLVGAVGSLACFSYGRELLAEHRALTRLPASTPGAPNVLLIVLDTVRADALSLYGYHRDTSPNLARLAKRGVRFERARATAPWTLPSHGSMFTGRWAHQLAVDTLHPLDATYPTLAEVLGARGYVSAGFVANLVFCHADYGLARGFQHYEDFPVTPVEVLRSTQFGERLMRKIDVLRFKLSDLLGDELLVRVFGDDPRSKLAGIRRKDAAQINRDALAWISVQKERPFFVFLNYFDPHDPYFPPRGAHRHFGLEPSTPSERATIRDWNRGENLRPPPSTIKLLRDGYDDCIAYLDDQLGRLFNELETRGVLENTVVLITADHGEHFGEHGGVFGHAFSVYSEEIRVPFMVIAPGRVPSGRVVSAPVSLRDLPATIVDLVGLGGKSCFPGRSLARFWNKGAPGDLTSADPIFAEFEIEQLPLSDSKRFLQSLSIGDMVYIRNAKKDDELYNTATDPAEAHSLAGSADARPTLEHLRSSLERLLADNPARRTKARSVGPGSALEQAATFK